MLKKIVVGLFGIFLFAGPAGAACSWITLTNGTTADANQVMNDLNCLAPLANPHFTGSVGIGMTNPTAPLSIAYNFGSVNIGTTAAFPDAIEITGSDNIGIKFTNTADSGHWWRQLAGVNASPNLSFLYFDGSIYQRRLTLQGDTGNVGIGDASPTYRLEVNGTVAGSSAYVNLSDERLKKDIRPIENALQIIEQIHGVSFRWKTPAERSVGKKFDLPVDKPQIGFIAQNLEKVLPQAVSVGKGKDAIMTVAESKIVPVLVEAVKQLKAANDKLVLANAKQADALHRLETQVRDIQHHETKKATAIR